MALETVLITVQDDEVVPSPVDGVTVQVYDSTGTTLQTSGVTGAVNPGEVEFILNGDDPPIEYQLRFSITGGSIVSPQAIEVYTPPANSPTGTNDFEITASLFTLPVAVDPRLCRASGYVRGPNGVARKGVDIHWVPCFNPLVVDDIGVLGERVATRTDSTGYIQVDLYRDGYYQATVESHESVQRLVLVPDRSSVNVNHLLFPIVVSAAFSPAGPFAVAVDDTLVVTPTITASDFRVLDGAGTDDVIYSTDDSDIATVAVNSDGTLTITGISAGSTNLTVARADQSIVYIPDPGISGGTVAITVT